MKIRLLLLCSLVLLHSVSAFAEVDLPLEGDGSTVSVEENNHFNGVSAVNNAQTTLFKDAGWHADKWQNSPVIIEITENYINLLFNRPEIVFGLRRGIRFDWQDTHEYSDGKVVTTYRLRRTAEGRAQIDYFSVLADDPKETASGSFEIESRP